MYSLISFKTTLRKKIIFHPNSLRLTRLYSSEMKPKRLYGEYFKRFSIVMFGLLSGHSVIHNILKPNMNIPEIKVTQDLSNNDK